VGGAFSLADRSISRTWGGGELFSKGGSFIYDIQYVLYCKWLPEGEDIVRNGRSGGVVSI
jgi:hypothetical protein